jgi:ADP-ribose pyrophosphatase
VEKTVYKGRVFNVREKYVEKNGKRIKVSRIVSEDSVVVLGVIGKRLLLEKQYRYVIGRYNYELPAGMINKGEAPRDAALRELEEETGYKCNKITEIFCAYVAPGTKTEKMHFFVAEGLRRGKTKMDDDEIIETSAYSVDKLKSMIKDNSIDDSKTISGILFYDMFIS